jgi:hypothetical protein
MKNLLIYSLHRSRGSAALYRTHHAHRMSEPFNTDQQCRKYPSGKNPEVWPYLSSRTAWTQARIDQCQSDMRADSTAVKIHGVQVETTFWARDWYRDVQADTDSWDLVVIERKDRRAQMLSFLLALVHRFYLEEQIVNADRTLVRVSELSIRLLREVIENHLRWYPSRGRVMTWSTRDALWFDRGPRETFNDQHSDQRIHLIENLEWTREVLMDIDNYYRHDWDQCISQLAPGWDFSTEQEPEYHTTQPLTAEAIEALKSEPQNAHLRRLPGQTGL